MPLTDNDIDIFFSTSDHAKTATYTPVAGTARTLPVIFDAPFSLTTAQGIEYQSDKPSATCKTSDLASAADGDTLTIDATVYKIAELQPDGTGITRILLSKD